MKKLFFLFLFVLTTCVEIKESFDDHIILEKSKEKAIASLIKPQIRQTAGVTSRHVTRYTSGVTARHTTRYTTGVTTRHSSKVQTTIPRKTSMKKAPIKGIDNLFTGKLGEEFRRQKDSVKKLIANFVKNNKWKSFLNKCKLNPGELYHSFCKNIPSEVCEGAKNFAKTALKYSK